MTMNWMKLGKIFDPRDHLLPFADAEYAQAPQVLLFEKYIRIYFSTRTKDQKGKYLSQVAFVEMSRDLRKIIRVFEKEIIPLGGLGTFDEHGIFPINPIRINDLTYAYLCGWSRRVSVSVETAIGLAVSHDDGLTFTRIGPGPVLAASLHEPFLVGDGFVMVVDGIFHMWYIFGRHWKKYTLDAPPDRIYKIGHAVSTDGIEWRKEEGRQIIADRLGSDESQALPCVFQWQGRYHMFFCFRESFNFRSAKGRGYRIGHAWSDDLHHWQRLDESPRFMGTAGDWDSDMQCYPHVFECDERVFMLYNGNQFGRYGFGAAELLP